MNPRQHLDLYRSAMNVVQRLCIDAAADEILKPGTSDRSIHAVATILLAGFRQIEVTLKAMNLVETLVGLPPPSSTEVDRSEYLTFLVGGYLQEVYILDQRLEAYAKKVSRAYKGRLDEKAVMIPIRNTLNVILRRRGTHVHESRYEDRRLGFLQGVAYVQHLIEGLEITASREFERIQTEWNEQIKTNNLATLELLDQYFDVLLSVVSREGSLILPRTGRGPVRSVPLDANPATGTPFVFAAADGHAAR